MGIDIYARWRGQREDEIEAQRAEWLSAEAGHQGYLREAYHGKPYATEYLCAEAFEKDDGAVIQASVLRSRLPHTLELVEERARNLYNATPSQMRVVKKSFSDFVTLCERKEKETGKPVFIVASY